MIGAQEPRLLWLPEGVDHPNADAAVELVTEVGLKPDPWQERRLRESLRRRGSRWAAFECALCLGRQNGKNAILEMRELAGLFLLRERLIVHSAHAGKTARLSFRRLEQLISGTPWLAKEVRHVWKTTGQEAIELKSGQRIEFQTRTKSSGRGYSGDLVVIDEAMEFSEAAQMALGPILTTAPDPQIWYASTAVDRRIHDDGFVFSGIRARALAGGDPSLAYWEWSLDYDDPAAVPLDVLEDEAAIALANPGYGLRFDREWIDRERGMFSSNLRGWAIERFSVGDWPDADDRGASMIDPLAWRALADPESSITGRPVFAFDVSPERSSSIAVAGRRADGLAHLEIVDHRAGTRWLGPRLAELVAKHDPVAVVCDAKGPAGSVLDLLETLGVKVEEVAASEHARGCGQLVDLVVERGLRHLSTAELDAAVAGASTRPLGDSWAWSRRSSRADISPLVAATLALWGLEAFPTESEPMFSFR